MFKLRSFLFRKQRLLATVYLLLLVALAAGTFGYRYWMPKSIDEGLAVVARWWAYRQTFEQVAAARGEMESGRLEKAEARLAHFLAEHSDVQPDQLETHAISAAHEALGEIYMAQGKPDNAAELLGQMAEREPLNYRLWYLAGRAWHEAGDLPAAAGAYRRAFKLALNHPDVAEGYLAVLAEQNAFEEILWVADHFERAVRRARPAVFVEVGIARSRAHRRVLQSAGIPVEHGRYFRHQHLSCRCSPTSRAAGEDCRIPVCEELLRPWPFPSGPLYVQLRFQHIYEGLQIEAFTYWTPGGERREYDLSAGRVAYHHRPHSAAEYYAEIRTDLDVREVARCEIRYSWPRPALSADALAIVEKAQVNVEAAGAG